jgi:hypothetical protein
MRLIPLFAAGLMAMATMATPADAQRHGGGGHGGGHGGGYRGGYHGGYHGGYRGHGYGWRGYGYGPGLVCRRVWYYGRPVRRCRSIW